MDNILEPYKPSGDKFMDVLKTCPYEQPIKSAPIIDFPLWKKQLIEAFEIDHNAMWEVYESWGEQDKCGLIEWFIKNKERWLK